MTLDLSVGALQAGYRDGALDPVTVAAQVHARARDRADENIWITLRAADELRAQAAAIAQRWPEPGRRPPLFGVPVAIKDNIDVSGLPTTAACPDFTYLPTRSAALVSRLTEAGALIVGKTNLDQFATGLTGTRSPYGRCRSPFSPDHISGGSSSGSALAVAYGLVSVAIGTDTAGSGRVPAAFTGTVGLKPSRGLVSGVGIVPACRSLDCPSVFALSVADAAATLRVLAGYDPEDPWSREFRAGEFPAGEFPAAEFPAAEFSAGEFLATDFPATDVGGAGEGTRRGLRVGVCDDAALAAAGTDKEIIAAYRESGTRLSAAGVLVVPVDIAPLTAAGDLLYGGPFVAERLASLEELLLGSPDSFYRETRAVLLKARENSAADAFRGIHRLVELRRAAARTIWPVVDAVLLPTVPTIPTVQEALADSLGVTAALGRFTHFTNLMDLAAVAVPAGFRADGLPIGVTFHGPAGRDRMLASLAGLLTAAGVG